MNDTKSSNIPSHNGNKTGLATPNYPQDEKVLFYRMYHIPKFKHLAYR